MFKQMISFAAVAGLVLALAGTAQAVLINVDFNGTNNPNNYTGAAVLGSASDTWNYITFADGWDPPAFGPLPLVDSTGAATSVTLTYPGGHNCFNPWGQGTNALTGDYIGVWGGGPQNAGVTLSGLAPGSYDVSVFGFDWAAFSVNGATPLPLDGSTNNNVAAFISGGNYVLTNAVVAGDGLMTILASAGGGGFGGFQITPEPGTMALLGLGSLGVLLRRRRR